MLSSLYVLNVSMDSPGCGGTPINSLYTGVPPDWFLINRLPTHILQVEKSHEK